ncbi:ribonuclease domain-containing protein [Ornithinimicrobium sp. Y1847]|uniref:ribonuclease domain-containing protein n=1 Tax=Ornithinimicrobium sp. Y1847 TaxID=3405419 RepID=UPI003B67F82A
MKVPPWLAGLLIVLVLVLLWWTFSGDGDQGGEAQGGSPTPTSAATFGQPAQTEESTEAQSTEAQSTDATAAQPGGTAEATTPHTQGTPEPTHDQGEDLVEPAGIDTRDWDGIDACDDDILPATMIPVIEDIWAGGPYDHPDRDGTHFGNFEGILPEEHRMYYREFTVETPGLHHRGQRRIVTGGREETDPDVWYYTQDHYESFCEFVP